MGNAEQREKCFLSFSCSLPEKETAMINPASVPLPVQKMANTFQLGAPQAHYATRTSYAFIYGGSFALLVGCIVLYGLPDFLRIVGMAWVIVGIVTLLFSFMKPKIVILVYSEGLIQSKKGEIEVVRWDQIKAIWKQIMTYSELMNIHEYKVCRNDGAMFAFGSSIPDVKTLGSQIERAVMQVLLPQFLARYHDGQVLSFESISVSMQGIRMVQEQKFLFWHECEGSFTNDDMLYIYKSNQANAWASLFVSVLPNAHILKELINHILCERAIKLLPHMLVDYRAGFPALFGELNLSLEGVSVHGEPFQSWQAIKNIHIDLNNRQVSVYLHDTTSAWLCLPSWMTPNVFLLKALAESVMNVYASV
jgi:hypothetical protein